jgi:hypothetical protein
MTRQSNEIRCLKFMNSNENWTRKTKTPRRKLKALDAHTTLRWVVVYLSSLNITEYKRTTETGSGLNPAASFQLQNSVGSRIECRNWQCCSMAEWFENGWSPRSHPNYYHTFFSPFVQSSHALVSERLGSLLICTVKHIHRTFAPCELGHVLHEVYIKFYFWALFQLCLFLDVVDCVPGEY